MFPIYLICGLLLGGWIFFLIFQREIYDLLEIEQSGLPELLRLPEEDEAPHPQPKSSNRMTSLDEDMLAELKKRRKVEKKKDKDLWA